MDDDREELHACSPLWGVPAGGIVINDRSPQSAGTQNLPYRTRSRIKLKDRIEFWRRTAAIGLYGLPRMRTALHNLRVALPGAQHPIQTNRKLWAMATLATLWCLFIDKRRYWWCQFGSLLCALMAAPSAASCQANWTQVPGIPSARQ